MTDIQSMLKAMLVEEYGNGTSAPDLSGAGNALDHSAPVPKRNPKRPGPVDLSMYGEALGVEKLPPIDGEKQPRKQPVRLAGVPTPTEKPDTRGLLRDFGRLTPQEQVDTVKAQKAGAETQVKRATARADKLRKLQDVDLGINEDIEAVADLQRQEQEAAPFDVSMAPDAATVRAGKRVMHAEDQLAGRAPLPTQTTLRNAVDTSVKTFLNTGPDVLKAGGIAAGAIPGIPEENVATRLADDAEESIRQAFPGDDTQTETFVSTLAAGGGSMAGFLVGNVVAKGAAKLVGASSRTAGFVGSAGTGAAVSGTGGYEDAQRHGAGALARYTSFLLNAGLGTTEALPIDRFFGRLNVQSQGRISAILSDTKAQSLEEFTQEVVQSLGSDVVARAVYDADREVGGPDVLLNGIVGGILGGSMGAASGATRRIQKSEDLENVSVDPGQTAGAEAGEVAPAVEPIAVEPSPAADPLTVESEPTTRAVLRKYGYSDPDIDGMSAEERALEAADASAAGIVPTEEEIAAARPTEGDGTRKKPVKAQSSQDIDAAAAQAAPEPSDAQKEAGNYKKGHVKAFGLDISIENPKGSTRSKTFEDGTGWSVEMPAHYGYVKRTEGADGDQVDVYLGDNLNSDRAFVVDQVDPADGSFDEHKVVLGTNSVVEAGSLYQRGFSDGSGVQRLGAITEIPVETFKDWLKNGDTTKPYGQLRTQQQATGQVEAGQVGGQDPNAAAQPAEAEAEQGFLPTKHVRQRPGPTEKGIVGFLRGLGGLKPNPELDVIDIRHSRPGLVSKRGKDLDMAREAAAEAGYFDHIYGHPEAAVAQSTPDDLVQLLDQHLRGDRDYGRMREEYPEEFQPNTEEEEFRRNSAEADIKSLMDEYDFRLSEDLHARAVELLMTGQETDADLAIEHAAIMLENEAEGTTANNDVLDDPIPGFEDDAVQPTRTSQAQPGSDAEVSETGQPGSATGSETGGSRAQSEAAGQDGGEPSGESSEESDHSRVEPSSDQSVVSTESALDAALDAEFGAERDYASMFAALPKDGDAWLDLKSELIEKYPEDGADIIDAMDAAGGRPDTKEEAENRSATERVKREQDAFAHESGQQIKEFVAAGGSVVLPTPGRSRQLRYTDPEMIDVRADGPYFQNGKSWNAVTKDQLNHMLGQVNRAKGKSVKQSEGAEQEEHSFSKSIFHKTEAGADGKAQTVLPGAERASDADLAQRQADAPMRAKREQKSADFGLFGDEKDQLDLVDQAQQPTKVKQDNPELEDHDALRKRLRNTRDPIEAVRAVIDTTENADWQMWELIGSGASDKEILDHFKETTGHGRASLTLGPGASASARDRSVTVKVDGKETKFANKKLAEAIRKAYAHDLAETEIGEDFADDSELKTFDPQVDQTQWGQEGDKVFPPVSKTDQSMVKTDDYMTQAEATEKIALWKRVAKEVGKTKDNSNKVVFSIFDASGSWSQPFRDAGYTVLQYDAQLGDDIIENFPIADVLEVQADGKEVVGVLSACPCTTFAGSGARWWKDRHDKPNPDMVEKLFGPKAARHFDTAVEANVWMVNMTAGLIDLTKPKFHVLENPIGRIEEMARLPKPVMRFNPNMFGDPYTKKTSLYGDFSTKLPTAAVEPTDGSKIQSKLSSKDKFERSLTPDGFSYAFFIAQDPDAQALLEKYEKQNAAEGARNEDDSEGAPTDFRNPNLKLSNDVNYYAEFFKTPLAVEGEKDDSPAAAELRKISNDTLRHYAGVYDVPVEDRTRKEIWEDMQAKGAKSRQGGTIISNDLQLSDVPELLRNSFRVGTGNPIEVPKKLFADFVESLRQNPELIEHVDNWSFRVSGPVGEEIGQLQMANYGPNGLSINHYSTRKDSGLAKVIGGMAKKRDLTAFLKQFVEHNPITPNAKRSDRNPPSSGEHDRLVIETGVVLRTKSGRETSPAPRIDARTDRRTKASLTRMNRWLYEEALEEAAITDAAAPNNIFGETAGYQQTTLRSIDPTKMSSSDQDTVNEILFGDPEGPTKANVVRVDGKKTRSTGKREKPNAERSDQATLSADDALNTALDQEFSSESAAWESAIAEAKTGSEAMDAIIAHANDADYRLIAERIRPLVDVVPVKVVSPGDKVPAAVASSMNGISVAVHYHETKTGKEVVYIRPDADHETVLHEYLHSAANDRLYTGNAKANADTPIGKIVAEFMELRDFLKSVYEERKKLDRLTDEEYGSLQLKYAVTDVREMVAYGLSNRKVQGFLKSVKYQGDKTAWSKFVETLRKLLNIPRKSEDALGRLIELSDALFDAELPSKSPSEIRKSALRDAKSSAKSAAGNTAKGLDEASKGLLELFGGGKTVGSGPAFDPDTYEKAKPHFRAAFAHFQAAADDVSAMAVALVRHLKNKMGFNREAIENMRPYLVRFMDDVKAGKETIGDVPGTGTDLESDRGNTDTGNTVGGADVSAAPRPNEPGTRSGTRKADGKAQGNQPDSPSLFDYDAAPVGTPGDRTVQTNPSDSGGSGKRGERGRSDTARDEGLPPTGAGAETARNDAEGPSSVKERIAAQKAAESTPVKPGIQNIRKTLPILLPPQQEDIVKAEERFAKPDAHGFLFTNGTGTGKTFTALGVAKRFIRRGKGNILILAPSKPILQQWKEEARDKFFIDLSILDGIDDAGSGVVATTYANFYQNAALQKRDFDLVIPDESQNLMANQAGEANDTTDAFRAITNHPKGIRIRAEIWNAELKEKAQAASEAAKALRTSDDQRDWHNSGSAEDKAAKLWEEFRAAVDRDAAIIGAKDRPKTLFLSATPFAYDKAVDYAEGFLFDYPKSENNQAYNVPEGRERFFVENFGYRMRYNKLTEPDAQVNRDLMARNFHEQLKKNGSLSGRQIEVEADYDRKFVLVDDAIGKKIDQALEWLFEAGPKFNKLRDIINKEFFNYLTQRRLLEAIKARHSIPIIQKHLDLGRKVVIFHEYNEGGGINPFTQISTDNDTEVTWTDYEGGKGTLKSAKLGEIQAEFLAANRYVEDFEFGKYNAPIAEVTRAFGSRAAVFNGGVSVRQRNEIKREFNKDGGSIDVVIVNSAAGEAGLSLHDTTGNHQRVLMFFGLPPRPTTAIQGEGRIYRVGQVSDAIFRYLNTGTAWERRAFASIIAERSGMAESLALGDLARGLRDSFVEAFQDSDYYPPVSGEGTGGKERDRLLGSNTISEFEKAKTYYFGQLKNNKRRGNREGFDYFATPEPLGLKMVEWANVKPMDKVLEPSAGHGAIARWFPDDTRRTLIEPSFDLASKAELASPGADVKTERFEDLHVNNKYDAIVMNPPFGKGGKIAMEHLKKALTHLRNGGRIVLLYPDGPAAEKRMADFYESDEARNLFQIGRIFLPQVTFERAGTKVSASIYVLEKQTQASDLARLDPKANRDLANAENINEFFDRIENLSYPDRIEPSVQEPETLEGDVTVNGADFRIDETWVYIRSKLGRTGFADAASLAEKHGGYYLRQSKALKFPDTAAVAKFMEAYAAPRPEPEAAAVPDATFDLDEAYHEKRDIPLYVAKPAARVDRETFLTMKRAAEKHGGYYSKFTRGKAKPGFQFESVEARQKFLDEMSGGAAPADAQLSSSDAPDGWGEATSGPEQSLRLSDQQVNEVRSIVSQVSGLSDVMTPERIMVPAGHNGSKAWGRFEEEFEAQGFYDFTHDVVAVSMALPDGRRVAFHESFHRLQNLFLTDQEKALLRREEGRLRNLLRRDMVREGMVDQMSQSEVEAEAFAVFALKSETDPAAANRGLHIGLRRAFNRLLNIFRRVRNYLSGAGYQTFEDVFEKARTGEMAERSPRSEHETGKAFSVHPVAPKPPAQWSMPDDARYRHERWLKSTRGFLSHMPTMDQVRRKVQDRFLIMRRYQEGLQKSYELDRLPEQFDVYQAESLYYGRAGERIAELREKIIDPLIEEMRAADISHEQLSLFLYAKHAPERNATIAERNPDMPDGGSGLTNQEAADTLKEFDKAGITSDLERLASRVYAMNRKALQQRYSAGLLSKEQFEQLKDRWQFYVPLRGMEGLEDSIEGQPIDGPKTGQGFQVKGKEFQSALGRSSLADSPLAYSLMNATEAITRAEKNRVGKTFLRLVQAFPNKKVWEVKKAEVRQRLNKDTGLVERYVVPLAFTNDQNVVSVKVGGNAMHIVVKDPRLVSAMKNLGSSDMNGLVRQLARFTRFYAALQTSWNPEFLFSNFFRDAQTALGFLGEHDIKGLRRRVAKNTLPAMKGMYRNLHGKTDDEWTKLAKRYREAGGKISFFEYQNIDTLKESINKDLNRGRVGRAAKKLMDDFVEIPNGAVENALRLATFEALISSGVTEAKAASAARELTVNFNRKGEWGSIINSLYVFFNASIQGNVRLVQLVAKSKSVRKAVMVTALTGFIFDQLGAAWSDDDEDTGKSEWDLIPEWERTRSVIFPIGDGQYKMPLAYGFNIPFVFGQEMSRMLRGVTNPLDAGISVSKTFLETMSPVGGAPTMLQFVSPTILEPAVQISENKNWIGNPLRPERFGPMDSRPDSQLAFDSVGSIPKFIAETLNQVTGGSKYEAGGIDVSPESIELFGEFLTGGIGRLVNRSLKTGESLYYGTSLEPNDIPFVRTFYRGESDFVKRNMFYDARGEVQEAHNAVRNMSKDNRSPSEIREFKSRHRAELKAYNDFKRANKELRKLRAERRQVEQSKTLSVRDKEAKVERIRKRELIVMMRAQKAYLKAKQKDN